MKQPSSQYHINIPGMGDVHITMQPYAIVISEGYRTNYTFDADGRLIGCFVGGVNYKRSLSNALMKKERANRTTPKTRTLLSDHEACTLIAMIRANVQRITHFLRENPSEAAEPALLVWLDAILAWDFERLAAQREVFDALYKPVGILPPDQYLSVVLQVTEGCSWNQCTFCTFYHDRRFRVKSAEEFRNHIQQVKSFFGASIGLRKSLFLSDANALIIPQPRLRELLHIVHEELPVGENGSGQNPAYRLNGIYSFLDIFGAERKTASDYRELRDLQVNRIYIGLETGDDEVFRLLNKPGSPSECVEAVRTIKQAGVGVGIILLAGAGGVPLAGQHIRHSVQVVAQMPMDADDMVYVSPLVLSDNDPYSMHIRERGIEPMDEAGIAQQVQALKAALREALPGRPRIALYHIEEFLY